MQSKQPDVSTSLSQEDDSWNGMQAASVSVILYNRPEMAKRLISSLRQSKPGRIYVIADGPKSGNAKDAERVEATRAVLAMIDWDCKVFRDFSATNLGLRRRVTTGLDWVFSEEKATIVLEDDCIPNPSFIPFCSELIHRYESNKRVGRIGSRKMWRPSGSKESYELVSRSGIWGWATWRDVWQEFRKWELAKPNLTLIDVLRDVVATRGIFAKLVRIKLLSSLKNQNQWGVRFSVFCSSFGLFGISPSVDLVANIGVGKDSTHTKTSWLKLPEASDLVMPMTHPDIRNSIMTVDKRDKEWSRILFLGFLGVISERLGFPHENRIVGPRD
jgi:hypothetical protein